MIVNISVGIVSPTHDDCAQGRLIVLIIMVFLGGKLRFCAIVLDASSFL